MVFSLSVEGDSPLNQREQGVQLQAQLELLEGSLSPLLQPRGPFHQRLLRDVLLFRDVLLAEEDEVDGVVLASKLTAAGYRVAVRQALGGGSGVQVFSNLRHSFLLVTAQDCPCAGIDFIVEPHFREQFEISHATPRYTGLLNLLPLVMVGTAAQLAPLVQLLCSEMSLAFEEWGLSLPPWRQSKSLLSKWLPSKARDYDLSPYSSPRAASPEPPFPLAISTAAPGAHMLLPCYDSGILAPISEGPSGSVTPATFSGDDASPRAVLRDASAALFSQQSGGAYAPHAQREGSVESAGGVPTPGAAPNLVRKSLLSSSLAASGQRSASPEQFRLARPPRVPPVSLPPPADSLHLGGGGGGLAYRVSNEWQQPQIRTVKMQGAAKPRQ